MQLLKSPRRRIIILITLFTLEFFNIFGASAENGGLTIEEQIIENFKNEEPHSWGWNIPGIITHFNTSKKEIALTFDACEGRFDKRLINYLRKEKIPATLFLSGRWIDNNIDSIELLQNPLFEIENHGLKHRVCSINGRSVYHLQATSSAKEIYEEIEVNAKKIEKLFGRKPKYYRPAGGYADDVCIKIANKLGHDVVNFNVIGDGGATYSKKKIINILSHVKPGSIVIFHMNHPESDIAEALIATIPKLKKQGIKFVQLKDVLNAPLKNDKESLEKEKYSLMLKAIEIVRKIIVLIRDLMQKGLLKTS